MKTKKKSKLAIVNIICIFLNIALLIGFDFVKGMAKIYILIPLAIVWLVSIGNCYLMCNNLTNKDESLVNDNKDDKNNNTLEYIMISAFVFMIFVNLFGLL